MLQALGVKVYGSPAYHNLNVKFWLAVRTLVFFWFFYSFSKYWCSKFNFQESFRLQPRYMSTQGKKPSRRSALSSSRQI